MGQEAGSGSFATGIDDITFMLMLACILETCFLSERKEKKYWGAALILGGFSGACKALESIPSTERNKKGGGAGRDERRKGGCINGRYPKS